MIAMTIRKIFALATCSSVLLLGVPLGTAGAFQDQNSAPNSQSVSATTQMAPSSYRNGPRPAQVASHHI
jgi:hypothetical protein